MSQNYQHLFALVDFRAGTPDQHGQECVEAKFIVIQSTSVKVGDTFLERWTPTKAPKYASSTSDLDRLVDFIVKLTGCDIPTAQQSIGYLLANEATQPVKGMHIRCQARTKPATSTAKAFTFRDWVNVPQSQEQIPGQRAQVEQMIATPAAAAAPAPQAAPQYAQPPAQYAQPAAAPAGFGGFPQPGAAPAGFAPAPAPVAGPTAAPAGFPFPGQR